MLDASDVGIFEISADQLLANGLNLIYALAAVVAIVMIIIAGISFATSAGSPDAVKKAKNMIIGAVAGLIIVLLAFAITQFILGRF